MITSTTYHQMHNMQEDVRGSSVVELMVWWVIRSILHGGPIELFLIPSSVGITKVMVCTVCLWDGAHKRSLAANGKE